MEMKVLFLPTARLTFDVELANKLFNESVEMLKRIENITAITPETLLTDPEMLKSFVEEKGRECDVILFQSTTFTDGEFIKYAIDIVDAPVIIWGVREPSIGGRLRLNSLTGVMSTANVLRNNNRKSLFTLGNPDEHQTESSLKKQFNVISLIKKLKALKIGVVGNYPNGFFFSDAEPVPLQNLFGVELKQYDLYKWFEEAKSLPAEAYQAELEYAKKQIMGLKKDDETVIKLAQFVTVAKKYISDDQLKSLAMRCWPDFFVEMNAAPCGVFSQLTEQRFPTACEADIHGSLSMYILQELTNGNPTYLGDVVNLIKENNSIILWHCGFAPYSLANEATGALAGVHPNRKIGVAMDFGIKPGTVTLFRVSKTPEGYRLVMTIGESLDVPNSYQGTSAEIKLNGNAEEFVHQVVAEGLEPHLAMVHGDVTDEIKDLGRILDIEILVL